MARLLPVAFAFAFFINLPVMADARSVHDRKSYLHSLEEKPYARVRAALIGRIHTCQIQALIERKRMFRPAMVRYLSGDRLLLRHGHRALQVRILSQSFKEISSCHDLRREHIDHTESHFSDASRHVALGPAHALIVPATAPIPSAR
jgi:hypothetical protein